MFGKQRGISGVCFLIGTPASQGWCPRCPRSNTEPPKNSSSCSDLVLLLTWVSLWPSPHPAVELLPARGTGEAGDKRHFMMSRPTCRNAAGFTAPAEQRGRCQPLAGQANNKFVGFFFYAVELFLLYSFSVISYRGIRGWPAHI